MRLLPVFWEEAIERRFERRQKSCRLLLDQLQLIVLERSSFTNPAPDGVARLRIRRASVYSEAKPLCDDGVGEVALNRPMSTSETRPLSGRLVAKVDMWWSRGVFTSSTAGAALVCIWSRLPTDGGSSPGRISE